MKAQIWSLDMIFSLVIFGFTITILATAWLTISNEVALSRNNNAELLVLQTQQLSDILLSPGTPTNWYSAIVPDQISTWGSVVPGIISTSDPSSLSMKKIYVLMGLSSYNYSSTETLFGIGYNYYIAIQAEGNSGWGNITIGRNPSQFNATRIYVVQRSSKLNGVPVTVSVMCWSNSSIEVG